MAAQKFAAVYNFEVLEETPDAFISAIMSNQDDSWFEAISGEVEADYEFNK